MWGISWRLNNTRQVPAARAFVSNQTGLMEERGDACDLGHLCCFASRTQQGSSGALTRHRLLHFRFVCTLLIFQRSYSALVARGKNLPCISFRTATWDQARLTRADVDSRRTFALTRVR